MKLSIFLLFISAFAFCESQWNPFRASANVRANPRQHPIAPEMEMEMVAAGPLELDKGLRSILK